MKNKRIVVVPFLLILIIIAGVIWWILPIAIIDVEPSEVSRIEIFHGGTGESVTVTDPTNIEYLINNFNKISLKKKKFSLGYVGYSYNVTIYGFNNEKYKNFIINSDKIIRKDPFFYEDSSNNIDYKYIGRLFDKKTRIKSEKDSNKLRIKIIDLNLEDANEEDLAVYNFVGNLTNKQKLYFKPKEHYVKQARGESIIIQGENKISLLFKGTSSKPKISPDQAKIAFIDNLAFEEIGKLHIYDLGVEKSNKVVDFSNFSHHDTTVKDVEWIDDNRLLLIVGYSTGTITQGGNLYLFDNQNHGLELVLETDKKEEITDITIDGSDVIITFVRWIDDNYEKYEYREETDSIDNY